MIILKQNKGSTSWSNRECMSPPTTSYTTSYCYTPIVRSRCYWPSSYRDNNVYTSTSCCKSSAAASSSYYYPYSSSYSTSTAAATSAAAAAATAALASERAVYDTLKRKEAEIADISYKYEKDLSHLETQLTHTKLNNNELKAKLVCCFLFVIQCSCLIYKKISLNFRYSFDKNQFLFMFFSYRSILPYFNLKKSFY